MLGGEARFVSLAEIIRSRPISGEAAASQSHRTGTGAPPELQLPALAADETCEMPPAIAPAALTAEPSEPSELAAAIRAARLFRAALADAFDGVAADLILALAAEVLGRELQIAPADITLIARRLIAERHADEPLSLRVCPADAGIACELPVVADTHLGPGDAVLVCRNGEIDARLAVRLAQVVAGLTR